MLLARRTLKRNCGKLAPLRHLQHASIFTFSYLRERTHASILLCSACATRVVNSFYDAILLFPYIRAAHPRYYASHPFPSDAPLLPGNTSTSAKDIRHAYFFRYCAMQNTQLAYQLKHAALNGN